MQGGGDRYNTDNTAGAFPQVFRPTQVPAQLNKNVHTPIAVDLDGLVTNLTLADMSIESELRNIADALAECRTRLQGFGLLDPETDRTLNWASMQVHSTARQLRGFVQVIADGAEPTAPGSELAQEAIQELVERQRLRR